jgi:putative sterol carrier protein
MTTTVKSDFEDNIATSIGNHPEKAKEVGAIYVFTITGDEGGTWTVDLKSDLGVRAGHDPGADCTIEVSADDWRQMRAQPASAMQLYMQGRLKVGGNVMLATKLQHILRPS